MSKIKSQRIIPNVPPESTKVSFALSSQDNPEHSGEWEFYAVFDFTAESPVNTQVAINVIKDVFLHILVIDADSSVLQVLEKSLKECKEALQKISPDVTFNSTIAIFKDEYVYVSIHGDSKALYLDGKQIMHVDVEKEGNYAGSGQKVENDKVMVLCTNTFFHKFPPKSLTSLTKPILAQDLDELSSAIILKVEGDEESKVVKGKPDVSSKPVGVTIGKYSRFIKPAIFVVGGLLLLIALFFLVVRPRLSHGVDQSPSSEVEKPASALQPPAIQNDLSKSLDEANKVKRIFPQVFYDISITDPKAAPTELALGLSYVAALDPAQGKIYVSKRDVTKFEELPQLFPGVKNLLFRGDVLVFTDNEGLKLYSLTTKSVSKSYMADPGYPAVGASSEYLDFTYAVSGERIVKFTKVGSRLVGALWAQNADFSKVVSVDIDGSIYLLFANGGLQKYTGGSKDDFAIVGLDKPIQKPLKVVTNANFKQIYVGDGAEGRIVAFDTDGVLSFQIKPDRAQLGSEWNDLKSFDISADEKTFFILSGTKVYDFSL